MSPLHIVAFTRDGAALAFRLASELGGEAWASAKYAGDGVSPLTVPVSEWAHERFVSGNLLIFISWIALINPEFNSIWVFSFSVFCCIMLEAAPLW